MKKLILGPEDIKNEEHKRVRDFYYNPTKEEVSAILFSGYRYDWSEYCLNNFSGEETIFMDPDKLLGILRYENDVPALLGQCALRQLFTDLNGEVAYTIAYDIIYRAESNNEAIDYARGIDWQAEEHTQDNYASLWSDYIDNINGIDIWYNREFDHYHFTEDIYESYYWGSSLQS